MRLAPALFAVVLAMCIVVGAALLIPETPQGHGFAHPEHPGMFRAPPGDQRHGEALVLGWVFGLLQIGLFVGLIALGARKGRRLEGLGRLLVVGAAAYALVWTLIVFTYRHYITDPAPELFLGLPLPTAIFVYLHFPLPVFFMLLFILGYKRWVLSDEDLRRYQRLLDNRQTREAGDDHQS